LLEATKAKRSLEEAGFEAHYGLVRSLFYFILCFFNFYFIYSLVFSQGADRETVRNFHLAPPAPEKMFLLSPPPSPPEGWKPLYEVRSREALGPAC
jgi:hypothetical protein